MNPAVRNVIIILVIAAVVAIVPGGGTAANVILQVASLGFLAAIAWVASIMYREHRGTLFLLGDRKRGLLYAAIAVMAVTLTATHRMWQSAPGSIAWLVLVAVCVYIGFSVVWSARRY